MAKTGLDPIFVGYQVNGQFKSTSRHWQESIPDGGVRVFGAVVIVVR
jgi:hypothetical protein